MFFGKYEIVIFREGKSGSRNVRLSGWTAFLTIILVLALIACNVWLWDKWIAMSHLDSSLQNAQRIIDEQKRQTLNLSEKITALSQDVERVQKFDNKLRILMNMDREPTEVGDNPGDFSRSYLPLHRQELAVRKMQDFLETLSRATRLEEVRQQDLLRALRDNRNTLTSMPTIWPVNGFISSSFGGRASPFGGASQFHKGLDIATRVGTPIVSSADGKVLMAGQQAGYGVSVEVDHGGGIITKYAHMQRAVVKPGDWVKRGEVIGYVGMTGRTTGPHLHYEVRLNGVPVNPMRYILE